MDRTQALLALIPAAYVVGSIPFGLIVGLAKGTDPRTAGSKNIGATNVGRLLGVKFFLLVFLLDMLKGALPTAAAGAVLHFHAADRTGYLLWVLVGFAAMLGHMFSCFLKFKGGKGVATSMGVMLGIFPFFTVAGLVGVVVWLIGFGLTRIVSVGSIAAATAFPVAYVLIGHARGWPILQTQLPLLVFAILVPVLIIYKHRANISRLLSGTELRAGHKSL
jgi:glycerol-3-phosphate acyltransferase PlsY